MSSMYDAVWIAVDRSVFEFVSWKLERHFGGSPRTSSLTAMAQVSIYGVSAPWGNCGHTKPVTIVLA